jgi:hypothetical protein
MFPFGMDEGWKYCGAPTYIFCNRQHKLTQSFTEYLGIMTEERLVSLTCTIISLLNFRCLDMFHIHHTMYLLQSTFILIFYLSLILAIY